jgi:subtilase family serine protease
LEVDETDDSGAPAAARAAPLRGLSKHVPPAVLAGRAALVGSLPATRDMHVTLTLPPRNQDALTRFLADVYDPSSPHYRQFLSVAEFADQFGPSVADYQATVDFAKANGFTVTDASENRMTVPIHGTAAQVERAFHTKLNVYRHPTEPRTFYSPDREPSLDLGVPVAHIEGLSDYSIPRRAPATEPANRTIPAVAGSGPGGASYLGSDMRAAYYGGTALTGSGQIVGIFELGGYNISDVNLTFSNAGQAYATPINSVLLDGVDGSADGNDNEEVLDITAVVGMAPGLSQVRVYVGNSWVDVLNKMATENVAKVISSSWFWAPDDPTTVDPIFQEMAAQGQTVFTASGDWGSAPNSEGLYFPAEDAYVTAVGGTSLSTSGAGGSWASEPGWSPSGGGISPDGIPIPSWQAGVANASNGGSTTLRNFPDVAAHADGSYYNCSVGQCGAFGGGTSLAAPLWAGFMALVNQQAVEAGKAPAGGLGFINPAIYAIGLGSGYASDFHDIVAGSNGTFTAVTGYDLVTGWGSPQGQSLINALAGPPAAGFTLTNSALSSGVSIKPGASSPTIVTVNDLDGFAGNVTLAVSGLPTGVTAHFGTDPTSQTSVLTLTASSSAPHAVADVTVTGTSGSHTATTSFALTVVAPYFTLALSPATITTYPELSASTTVAVTGVNGLTGNVALSASGLPSGVTAAFSPNPAAANGTSQLTLTTSGTATIGTSTATITGTSGSISGTTALGLTVAPGASCHVDYTIYTYTATTFGANVYITNTGTAPLSNWTLTWTFANGQTITSLWNGVETQSGANVTVSNESYNGYIPVGGDYRGLGFNGDWNGVTNAVPASIALNGTTCTIN